MSGQRGTEGKNQFRTWRRDPVGAGLKVLGTRNRRALAQHMTRHNLFSLEVDEFEDQLRADGCSEKMIANELEEFKKHKEEMEAPRRRIKEQAANRKKAQPEGLDYVVEAEIRRTTGVAADEILREMNLNG